MTTNAKARILVLDDDIGTQSTYQRILEIHGYQVATAGSGSDGLALLRSENEKFDLILSDLRMPDVSGLEVLAEVHQNGPDVPVVIITAFGTAAAEAASRLLGAVDFVDKLPDVDTLVDVVQRTLRNNPQHTKSGLRHVSGVSPIGHAAQRWMSIVLPVTALTSDVATLAEWGVEMGHAPSTIKAWCAAAGVHGSDSLGFARALRVVKGHGGRRVTNWYNVLNIRDFRTLNHFLERAGFSKNDPVPDLETFFTRQRFVLDSDLLATVRISLRLADC